MSQLGVNKGKVHLKSDPQQSACMFMTVLSQPAACLSFTHTPTHTDRHKHMDTLLHTHAQTGGYNSAPQFIRHQGDGRRPHRLDYQKTGE